MMSSTNIPDTIRQLLAEYKGGSMDPILYATIDLIEKEVIGKNETVKDKNIEYQDAQDMAIRNHFRQKQREQLRRKEFDSLETAPVNALVALVLDDYRRASTTPEEDLVGPKKTIDSTVELIISAIESGLLPKGREVVAGKDESEVAQALLPLFLQQLKVLGLE